MPVARTNRNERLNVRVTKPQARLIRLAARSREATLSSFVVESAVLRAEETLASQVNIVFTPKQWDEFTAALDRPAKYLPRLQKLMSEPSLLERNRMERK